MGPTPALACQVPPIHEVLGPTHLDIPLLTGFLSPPQGFEPVTKSIRSLGKHPCYQLSYAFLLWHPLPFMGPTPALACQVPPIHEVLGPTHLDIPLLTGFLSPLQGFELVTKSLRSLGKHPCYQLSCAGTHSLSCAVAQLVAGMLP